MRYRTSGCLPSRRTSLPIVRYQSILIGDSDRGTRCCCALAIYDWETSWLQVWSLQTRSSLRYARVKAKIPRSTPYRFFHSSGCSSHSLASRTASVCFWCRRVLSGELFERLSVMCDATVSPVRSASITASDRASDASTSEFQFRCDIDTVLTKYRDIDRLRYLYLKITWVSQSAHTGQ